MGLAHYKLILAYKGTAFAGFQRQAEVITVQAAFESALGKLGWQGDHVLSAGRTDAGVHARGQVVSFHLDWKHSTEDLQNALNHYLPDDMAVRDVCVAEDGFHPRYSAKSRQYRYQVYCQPVRDPLREAFAWRVWPPVSVELMNEAAVSFVGSHDFKAFGSPMTDHGVTVREVFSAQWFRYQDEWHFDISANAFLYHMVRRIVFLLVSIGQEKAPPNLVADALSTGKLELTGLAPAAGLYLQEVKYS